MSAPRLSDFLRTNASPILDTWERFAAQIPSAGHMKVSALRDHVGGMLSAIATDLDRAQTPLQQSEKSQGRAPLLPWVSEAALHGAQRATAGFTVNEGMSEFRALRASVLRLWLESSPGDPPVVNDQLVRFNEAIDQAIAESLGRYAADKAKYTHMFDALLSSSSDINLIFDPAGNFIYANKTVGSLYDMPLSELVHQNFFDLRMPAATQLQRRLRHVIETRLPSRGEFSRLLASGKALTYEYYLAPVMDGNGGLEAIAATARDISERKAAEEEIRESATHDVLTGLPNRSLFGDRLELEVERSKRSGLPLALLFIDLDGFKAVNDRLGHHAGDILLRKVARRIDACVRAADTVARLGGDEFTVILADIHKTQHVEILAQEVLEALARPFIILDEEVQISGSIGITLFPLDATSPEELVRNADQAMYVAKRAGRGRFSFFGAGMRDAAWARLKVIDELRHALERKQFAIEYQPIVELVAGRIIKAEALLRWHRPAGLLLPAAFIGLAEETGLIGEIGDWVLAEAGQRAREWSAQLGAPFQVSVNKSAMEFVDTTSAELSGSHLAALRLVRDSIAVEISEGVLLDPSPSVIERLANLHDAGVALTIDDFGAGYSSLACLRKFDVGYLKIDQPFGSDTATTNDACTIAEATICMAHKLGLKVIAEGVETVEQRDWLKTAGCDYAQGYLFSKPLPAPDFGHLLGTGRVPHPVQSPLH